MAIWRGRTLTVMARHGAARVIRSLALLLGLGLAIAASAALVLTKDLELLRLAVIAALWAFLIAAFVVAGQRRSDATPAAVAEPGSDIVLRRTHELELASEVAKRREFELVTEVRIRREIEAALREDVAALRSDLVRLRHDILERWDGELRVERVAVHSESTRVSGFGATFHALQDEARRLGAEGRPLFEVETAKPLDELDNASTIEFSVVPPADADPVRVPVPDTDPALPRQSPEGRRHRARHAEEQELSVDASTLMRRLKAEEPAHLDPRPRRRRYRDDDETNDVLARVLRR